MSAELPQLSHAPQKMTKFFMIIVAIDCFRHGMPFNGMFLIGVVVFVKFS